MNTTRVSTKAFVISIVVPAALMMVVIAVVAHFGRKRPHVPEWLAGRWVEADDPDPHYELLFLSNGDFIELDADDGDVSQYGYFVYSNNAIEVAVGYPHDLIPWLTEYSPPCHWEVTSVSRSHLEVIQTHPEHPEYGSRVRTFVRVDDSTGSPDLTDSE